MDRGEDERLLPLSALQHFLYCPRQCALIHVDGLWAENVLTVEGEQLHALVDQGHGRARDGIRVAHGVNLRSLRLGVTGKADALEFAEGEPPHPVEYKRGKAKRIDADRVQLCAQGLCLEEMLGQPVPRGSLFYGLTRRRETVEFDDRLRTHTEQTIHDVRELIDSGRTPRMTYDRRLCDRCSLKDLCLARGTGPERSPERYLARSLHAALREDVPSSPEEE